MTLRWFAPMWPTSNPLKMLRNPLTVPGFCSIPTQPLPWCPRMFNILGQESGSIFASLGCRKIVILNSLKDILEVLEGSGSPPSFTAHPCPPTIGRNGTSSLKRSTPKQQQQNLFKNSVGSKSYGSGSQSFLGKFCTW